MRNAASAMTDAEIKDAVHQLQPEYGMALSIHLPKQRARGGQHRNLQFHADFAYLLDENMFQVTDLKLMGLLY